MTQRDDWWRGLGRLATLTGADRRTAAAVGRTLDRFHRRRRVPTAEADPDPDRPEAVADAAGVVELADVQAPPVVADDPDRPEAVADAAGIVEEEVPVGRPLRSRAAARVAGDPVALASAVEVVDRAAHRPLVGTRSMRGHWGAAQPGVRVLLRIASLVLTIALVGALTAAVGVAVAPHGQALITAVEGQRESQALLLEDTAQRSKMYDAYGGVMTVLRDAEDREWIPLDRMPESVVLGVLAVEDADFYEHDGVDWLATVRAASENVAAGEITQGGSTLTQQLVKLQFVGSEQTLERKIREAMLARDLEEQYSKDEILEYYLNTIYFGNSAYGVQAAAEIYFGKNAAELDYGDVALLAGLIRSPGVFTFSDPDIDFARLRRSRSLERMVELELLTEAQASEVEQRPIPTFSRSPNDDLVIDYFAEEVKRRLLEMPELGATREARRQAVFQGGLRIYTTFDPILDQYAQDAVAEVFPDRSQLDPFEVALASIDPGTGAVRAMLGGDNFSEEQFNLATQGRRQPGSSFKTYVLTTAFEQGTAPNDVVNGRGPCSFDIGESLPRYEVQNFANSGGGLGSISSQTQRSSNCAFVRLGLFVGLEEVVATTSEMVGLDEGRLFAYPSMSLGAQELTPLEQAIGYSVLANDGMRMEPFLITRIEDRNGDTLFEHVPTGRQVVSESTARNVTDVLVGNVRGGTGRAAILPSGQPSAGKTGTAQNFEDAWFVGYTPQLATAVWMGHPEEKVPMLGVAGRNVTGGSFPAQVWGAFMQRALDGEPIEEFGDPVRVPGNRDLIYLPGERCTVGIDVGELSFTFNLGCGQVTLGDDGFGFAPDAICPGVEVPQPDGSSAVQDVPCADLETVLTPPTTEPEPTDEGESVEGDPPPAEGEAPPTTEAPAEEEAPPATEAPPVEGDRESVG
ncbi:MAG: transglycosylase domain-containing protein [Actinomycetota bacterium]